MSKTNAMLQYELQINEDIQYEGSQTHVTQLRLLHLFSFINNRNSTNFYTVYCGAPLILHTMISLLVMASTTQPVKTIVGSSI